MALPFQEAFGAAAGVLGNPPWTQAALSATTLNYDGAGSGKASAFDASFDVIAYDNSNTYPADQYAQVVIAGGIFSGQQYAEVFVRCSGTGGTFKGYQFLTDGKTGGGAGSTELWVYSGGTATVLTNFAVTFVAGDVMRIEVKGTTVECFRNGVSLGTFTDSVAVSGAPGCGVFNSASSQVTLDNFEGGSLASSPWAPEPIQSWVPPFVQTGQPRSPLGFLLPPVYSYVEGPTAPPPPRARPAITLVKKKNPRQGAKSKATRVRGTTGIKVRTTPAPPVVILKKKARKARVAPIRVRPSTTRVKPKGQRPVLVLQGRRKKKLARPITVTPTRRATTAGARPRAVVTQVRPPKPRRRKATIILSVARFSQIPAAVAVSPKLFGAKARTKKRIAKVLQVRPRRVAIVQVTKPRKTITLVLRNRSGIKKKAALVFLQARLSQIPPLPLPVRPPLLVKAPKKKKAPAKSQVLRARIAAAPSAAIKPRSPITVVRQKKGTKRLGAKPKAIRVRKPRTPYITGVTRDSGGTPVPNCQVYVFKTAGDVLVASGTSDASGVYLLPVPSYTDNLFVVAYRADSPDIFGTTVNWLVANA